MSRQSERSSLMFAVIAAALCVLSGCGEPDGGPSPEDRWLKSPDADRFADEEPAVPRKPFLSVIGLNPERIEEYRRLHENVPPDVQNALHASDIYNYSVFIKLIDDEFYALRYYEFAGADHEVAMAKLDVDPAYGKWRNAYESCQVPVSPRTSGQWWAKLEEICHID